MVRDGLNNVGRVGNRGNNVPEVSGRSRGLCRGRSRGRGWSLTPWALELGGFDQPAQESVQGCWARIVLCMVTWDRGNNSSMGWALLHGGLNIATNAQMDDDRGIEQ